MSFYQCILPEEKVEVNTEVIEGVVKELDEGSELMVVLIAKMALVIEMVQNMYFQNDGA